MNKLGPSLAIAAIWLAVGAIGFAHPDQVMSIGGWAVGATFLIAFFL